MLLNMFFRNPVPYNVLEGVIPLIRAVLLVLAASTLGGATVPANAGAISIDRWGLETLVFDSVERLADGSYDVEMPFQTQHHVVNGVSEAVSFFDFSMSPDTASFLIQASHTAFDGNGGTRSFSGGNIHVTPSVDLLLTATGTYAYDMPGWDMDVHYALVVSDSAFQERFVQSFGDSTFKGPTSGIFSLSGTDILPAGETSIIRYIMYIDGFGSSGLLASGSGEIHFTLAVVPEPSTIALLAFGLACLRKPNRRLRLEA